MSKEINRLTESILNELAIISQKYKEFRKVYDGAFKRGLPLWEKKAKARGYMPCDYSDAVKYFDRKISWNDEMYLLKDLTKTRVGRWTLTIMMETVQLLSVRL